MQKDEVLRLLRDPNLIHPEKLTLLSNIANLAETLGMSCYVVGGFARDLLLQKPINDFDIVVEGDAIALGKSLVEVYGGKLTPHFKFHTAIWHLPDSNEFADLITARKETYEKPGALPTVTPSTIDDDLRRRDFTINAMAIRLNGETFGEILDPLNGQSDLKHGLIRVLHPNSFIDDPTRIFRAIRYEQRYKFEIHAETLKLVDANALNILHSLSGERLRHELDLMLDEDASPEMIFRASDLGVLKSIHPNMPPLNPAYIDHLEIDTNLDVPSDRRTMGYVLWFLNLMEEDVLLLANRLSFTNDLTLFVWAGAQLKRSIPYLSDASPSEWVYSLEKLPLLSIFAVYLVSGENALLSYISIWRHVKPRTTGGDLKAMGLMPGPRFSEILIRLRSAWLDGEVNNESQEKELLAKLI